MYFLGYFNFFLTETVKGVFHRHKTRKLVEHSIKKKFLINKFVSDQNSVLNRKDVRKKITKCALQLLYTEKYENECFMKQQIFQVQQAL